MYSPFRHVGSIVRKTRPIHLTFFVTKRCNSRCPFCFYLQKKEDEPHAEKELDLDEIRRVSRSFGSLLWLAFSGGEVFLREDLAGISRVFYENNRPAIILFPTNGLLPDLIRERMEQILMECPDSIIAVKLSMDGIGAEHDRIRSTPGSFGKTMETYRLLGDLLARYPNFELGVNTVFLSGNEDSMDEIIDFVRGLENVKTHTISLVRGNLPCEEFKQVDFTKYLKAIRRLEENLKDRTSPVYRFRGARLKAAQDILQRRLIHRTASEQRRIIPCYAGQLNLVLSEEGDVYPCEILSGSFGNIRDFDYDIEKVIESEDAKKLLRSIRENRCFCTHECYFMTNILFNPALYPELFREYITLKK